MFVYFIFCAARCCLDQYHRTSHFCLSTRLMHTVSSFYGIKIKFPASESKSQFLYACAVCSVLQRTCFSCARSGRSELSESCNLPSVSPTVVISVCSYVLRPLRRLTLSTCSAGTPRTPSLCLCLS